MASEGYEPIGNSVDYMVTGSKKAHVPEEFPASGSIHVHLLPESNGIDKFVDIRLSSSITLTKIRLEMAPRKSFNSFKLVVVESGLEYPDEWTDLGVRSCPFFLQNKNHILSTLNLGLQAGFW